MFELCAQKHQVILEYEEDRMVLIAIRNNHTGDYMTLATLIEESKTYKVPMVGCHALHMLIKQVEPIDWKFGKDYTDAKSLLVLIKAMDNLEGQVICMLGTDPLVLLYALRMEPSTRRNLTGIFLGVRSLGSALSLKKTFGSWSWMARSMILQMLWGLSIRNPKLI